MWVDTQVIFKILDKHNAYFIKPKDNPPRAGEKEAIRAARHAAEMTDNALQQLLNRADEKNPVCTSS
ncbi:hypothetical protein INR49_023765 [Caranx melampygus]|nr:hypothetical protein INR49_023765 [Caranx melampygus]